MTLAVGWLTERHVIVRRKERSQTWSEAESAAMKRQALLDCIAAAKEQYHHAWACTSVDLAIEVSCLHAISSESQHTHKLGYWTAQLLCSRHMAMRLHACPKDGSSQLAHDRWGID